VVCVPRAATGGRTFRGLHRLVAVIGFDVVHAVIVVVLIVVGSRHDNRRSGQRGDEEPHGMPQHRRAALGTEFTPWRVLTFDLAGWYGAFTTQELDLSASGGG